MKPINPAGGGGSAGPTGPTGAQGAQGAQGSGGVAGSTGPTGPAGAVGAGSGDVLGQSSSVDSEICLFSATGGKTIKRATGSGLVKATSGVYSVVTAPSGTVMGTSDTQSPTNKTFDATNAYTTKAGSFTLQDDTDATKQAKFVASGITTGTTRSLTLPNKDTTLVGRDTTDTFTNKTLTAPSISDFTNAGHDHQGTSGGGALDASAIATGTIAPARLGSGSPSSSTVLFGDGSWGMQSSVATPTGVIAMYGAAAAPSGWQLCTGSAISRTTYSALFAVIGTTYGAGDGATTFNLPNLQGRVPIGKDSGTFASLGGTGGAETVTLTAAQSGLPAHTHAVGTLAVGTAVAHQHTYTAVTAVTTVSDFSGVKGSVTAVTGVTTASANTGSAGLHIHGLSGSTASVTAAAAGSSHTNLPPYLTVTFIIKE